LFFTWFHELPGFALALTAVLSQLRLSVGPITMETSQATYLIHWTSGGHHHNGLDDFEPRRRQCARYLEPLTNSSMIGVSLILRPCHQDALLARNCA
jgi:hypothetical protein